MEITSKFALPEELNKIIIRLDKTDKIRITVQCVILSESIINRCEIRISANEAISLVYMLRAAIALDINNGDGSIESILTVHSRAKNVYPTIIVEYCLGYCWRMCLSYADTNNFQGIDLDKDDCLKLIELLESAQEHAVNNRKVSPN